MDTEEFEMGQDLADEFGLDNHINNSDEDELQLIIDADYDDINLSYVNTLLSDAGISDLYTAIELVRDRSAMTKESLLDVWLEQMDVDQSIVIYLDMDHVWNDVFVHSGLCEMDDGTYFNVP